jgi:oligoendopeptidase F
MNTLATTPFPPPTRRWLPDGLDVSDVPALERLVAQLAARPLPDASALGAWLADVDELESALDAAEAHAAIATTCHTDDLAARERHLDLQTRVLPAARALLDGLDRLYLASPHRASLDRAAHEVHERAVANRAALFRAENLPVAAAISRLVAAFDERSGSLTVHFRGESRTPQQMARFLDEPDRAVREEAWQALARCRLGAADELETLFEQLLAQRALLAANAGFPSYREHCFRERERFDYGVEDCEVFHAAVEEHVVPAMTALHRARRTALGVETLLPWDLAVDPRGRPPLRPFHGAEELCDLATRLFERVDGELAEQFRFLRSQRLLDLENRPGKAPGGYQSFLEDRRLPFIFSNAVGVAADLRTLLHEGGHAFHALAARGQPLRSGRHAPLEFAEVASMGMELLASDHLAQVLGPQAGVRALRAQLERALELLPWVATIDAFQHWLYTYPEHSRAERAAYWIALRRRFEPSVHWAGTGTGTDESEWRAREWQRQLHLFKHPFYYIEYGIAQVGALQLWLNVRRQGAPAIAAWREALALGGSRPLPELFTAAHLCFDFGPGMLATLTAAVQQALAELPDG